MANQRNMLSADDILGAKDIQTEEVFVPEWNGVVLVRGMSGVERDAFEDSLVKQRGKRVERNMENFRARLLQKCLVDEQGSPLFKKEQIPMLGRKSSAALDRCVTVAQRLSGISDEDVEELTKNSEREDGTASSSS